MPKKMTREEYVVSAELEKVEIFSLKIFTKSLGAVLSGVFLGCKELPMGGQFYVVKASNTASCQVGHHGREATAIPGDLVAFSLTEKGKADFREQGVVEGDVIHLQIFNNMNVGHGRFIWDERLRKDMNLSPKTANKPTWSRIVRLANEAYAASSDEGARVKMLLLAAAVIDFDADRNVVSLVEAACAAKLAHDGEYVRRGCWKVGDDGESNATRWLNAATKLAQAMLDQEGEVKS